MGRKINRFSLWVRRQSHIAVIATLNRQINIARDSAEYYRRAREALMTDAEDLEVVARENYNMQRPSEDVYILVR